MGKKCFGINKIEDEEIVNAARKNFALLEAGDEETVALWEKFRSLSLEEYKKMSDLFSDDLYIQYIQRLMRQYETFNEFMIQNFEEIMKKTSGGKNIWI